MREPWTEIRPDSEESARALVSALYEELSALQRYVYRDACRAAALAWAYNRERLFALSDDAVPDWVAPWLPWLRTDDRRGRYVPSENVVRKGTDTVLAWMMSDLPLLRVGVEGTDLPSMLLSQDRSAALKATINTREARWQIRRGLIDVVLTGIGFLKPRVSNKSLCFESRRRQQVLWDPYAAEARDPRVVHEWYPVDRRALLAELRSQHKSADENAKPALARAIAEIEDAKPVHARTPPWAWESDPLPPDIHAWEATERGLVHSTDQVFLSESYLMATGPEAGDGRHVICCWAGKDDAIVLHDATFERITPPIVTWHYQPPQWGSQATGVGDAMLRWQQKVDAGNVTVTEALEVLGKALVIGDEQIFPDIAAPGLNFVAANSAAFGEGARFQAVTQEPLSQQHLQWLMQLPARALDDAGISQMLSEGASQLGANAPAIALQAEERRVRTRLSGVIEARDYGLTRLGTETLHALDDLVSVYPDVKIRWQRDGSEVEEPWRRVMPPSIQRTVEIELQGAFAGSFAAQLAAVQDLSDRGLVSDVSRRLAMLDDPDIRRMSQYELAPIQLVLRQMRRLIDDSGSTEEQARRWGDAMPDESTPYEIADEISQRTLWLAQAMGSDDEVIERLAIYRAELAEFAPQPPAPPMAPGAAPGMPAAAAAPEMPPMPAV